MTTIPNLFTLFTVAVIRLTALLGVVIVTLRFGILFLIPDPA
jgi:hypothetical protein